jgi:putative peptidoglycan lipid II flippase
VSDSDAIDFFNYTFWRFIIGGIVLAGVFYIASGPIFHSYLSSISPDKRELGIKIFNLFLVTIPLNAGMSIIMAYQQAKFKFTYPAISLILLNIIVIIMVLLFSDLLEILVLPISFVISYSAAFIFLIVLVKENFRSLSFETLKFKYRTDEMRTILFLIVIEGSSLSYVLIDRYFISDVSVGGIAALNYAFVIYSLPISLFSIPLITTMFSKFSNSPQTLQVDYKNSLNMNFFIMIPFMFILFFWGDHFLRLFYERGRFTASDTLTTYTALKYYSLSLVFLSSYFLFVKMFYSINQYLLVLKISIVAFALKLLLNILLVKELQQEGLALSTSIIYVFLCISGFFFLIIKNKFLERQSIILALIYFMVNGFIAYSISYLVIANNNLLIIDLKIVVVPVFIFIYMLNSFILNDNEFRIITSTVTKMLK